MFLGPENRVLEHWFASMLAPHSAPGQYLLIGPPGSGKTFVVTQLCRYYRHYFPDRGVIQVTAPELYGAHERSRGRCGFADWESRLAGTSLFVLDEIHCALGVPELQAVVLRVFDTLVRHNGNLVMCSRGSMRELAGLLPPLGTRLEQAVHIPVEPPGPSSAADIVHEIAKSRGLLLSKHARTEIARWAGGSVLDLYAAVQSWEDATRQRPGIPDEAILRHFCRARPPGNASLTSLARLVGGRLGVLVQDIRGSTRRRAAVLARGIVAHLAKEYHGTSLHRIGQFLGGRDHSTILHAIRQVRHRLSQDAALVQLIADLRERIHEDTAAAVVVKRSSSVEGLYSLDTKLEPRSRQHP